MVAVALVARDPKSRTQIASYLRSSGYEIVECAELSSVTRFGGVVIVDDADDGEALRGQVQSRIKPTKPLRVVVISSRPAAWRPLASALSEQLTVLVAPAFGWDIVDALRAPPPSAPG